MFKQRRKGISLLELMLVTLFLSIIGVYTWSYLRSTLNTQQVIEDRTSIQQTGIAILNRLTDDISQIFFVESYQKLTQFKGEAHAISFTSLSHDSANPTDRESDEAKISYTLEPDTENTEGDTQVLVRKEVPYFTGVDEKDEAYVAIPVSNGIVNLDFTYSRDGQKYVDEWDVYSADHLNKLPKLIKIAMTIRDREGREEFFETLVKLPITEDINITASAASAGTGSAKTGTTSSSGTKTTGSTNSSSTGTTNSPQGTTNVP